MIIALCQKATMRIVIVLLAMAFFVVIPLQPVKAAYGCVSVSSGNWSSPATWTNCGGGIPGAVDQVSIASGHTITVDIDASAANLTINVNSAVSSNGINIADSKVLTVTGMVTLSAPINATSALNVGNGNLVAGSINIIGGAAGRYATVSVNNGTVTAAGDISFAGFSAQSRYTSTGASTTTVGGNFGSGGTLVTSGSESFNFNGSGPQVIGQYSTYSNINIYSAGSVLFAGDTKINGNLAVNSGSLVVDSIDLTVVGATTVSTGTIMFSSTTGVKTFADIIVNSSGKLDFTDAESVTCLGDFMVNGTGAVIGTTGVWTFQKPGGGLLDGTAGNVSLTDAKFSTNYTTTGTTTFSNVVVDAGAVLTNLGLSVITTSLGGNGQLVQSTGSILDLKGDITIAALDAATNANQVRYTRATGSQSIKATTYHNLYIDMPGHTGTLSAAMTVNGDLTVNSGNLDDNGFQITGTSSGTLTMADSSTLTLGKGVSATSFPTGFVAALSKGSTVNYNANAAQVIAASPVYGNLKTTSTLPATKTAAGVLNIAGSFTNNLNNIFDNAGYITTVGGNGTMDGPDIGLGKIVFTGGTSTHYISGQYTSVEINDTQGAMLAESTIIDGNLLIAVGSLDVTMRDFSVTGVTTINGALVFSDTTGNKLVSDLIINGGGVVKFDVAEDLTIDGDLRVNDTGVLSGSTGLLTFGGVNGQITGTSPLIVVDGNSEFTSDYSIDTAFQGNTITVQTGGLINNNDSVTVKGSLAGSGSFNQAAGSQLKLENDITIVSLDASTAPNTVSYAGANAQTIKPVIYDILAVNDNTNGNVNIVADTTANSVLQLGATKITTGVNVMEVGVAGTLTRTSGYVYGNLRKHYYASGAFTFAIGDSVKYAPIDLNVVGLSHFGSATASTVNADHPDTIAGTSLIDKDKSVNRVWTLLNDTMAFTSYDATLHFEASDVDSAADINTMSVSKKTAGVWAIAPGGCASYMCTLTGLSAMSEFQAGNVNSVVPPVIPPITHPVTIGGDTIITATTPSATSGVGLLAVPPAGGVITDTGNGATSAGGSAALFDILSEFAISGNPTTIWAAIIVGLIVGALLAWLAIYCYKKYREHRRQKMHNKLQTKFSMMERR